MKKFATGTPVRNGVYVSLWPPDGRFVGMDGDAIDGRAGAKYVRVPSIVLLIASPIIGGLFVILFPLLILASLGIALAALAVRLLRPAADSASMLARVGWQPVEAGFNGTAKKREAPATPEEVSNGELADLAEQVDKKRAEERRRGSS